MYFPFERFEQIISGSSINFSPKRNDKLSYRIHRLAECIDIVLVRSFILYFYRTMPLNSLTSNDNSFTSTRNNFLSTHLSPYLLGVSLSIRIIVPLSRLNKKWYFKRGSVSYYCMLKHRRDAGMIATIEWNYLYRGNLHIRVRVSFIGTWRSNCDNFEVLLIPSVWRAVESWMHVNIVRIRFN